jgi:hypothetical protein
VDGRSLICTAAEQSPLDQIVSDALHFDLGDGRLDIAANTVITLGPITADPGQRDDSRAAQTEVPIVPRIQKYNPLIGPACVHMLREAITLIARGCPPGVRLDSGHQGWT